MSDTPSGEAGQAPFSPGSNVVQDTRPASLNLWVHDAHALSYLEKREEIPYRDDALRVLLELLPPRVDRVLDLGSGDGSTLALLLAIYPDATGVAVDFGDEMLRRAHERFDGDARVEVKRHDMSKPLPDWGTFDAVVSSFAIHHLAPSRQRALYTEVFDRLTVGGVFFNVEHVASRTETLHHVFLRAVGMDPYNDDPSNQLVDVYEQVGWLDAIGYADVDCFWKWRELAVFGGWRPSSTG